MPLLMATSAFGGIHWSSHSLRTVKSKLSYYKINIKNNSQLWSPCIISGQETDRDYSYNPTAPKRENQPSESRDRRLSASSINAVFCVLRTLTYISRSVREAFSVSRLQFSSRIWTVDQISNIARSNMPQFTHISLFICSLSLGLSVSLSLSFFTDRMPFLSPNQQRQSTGGMETVAK